MQLGLSSSINRIFQARFQRFICRSRLNAASRVSWASYQTSRLPVKPVRKSRPDVLAMFPGAPVQIVCRSNVENAMRSVRHDVYGKHHRQRYTK